MVQSQYSITEDPEVIFLDEPERPIDVFQNGWTPQLANVDRENLDGSIDLVQKVVDWFGGFGTKPQVNLFVAVNGFTNNIDNAVPVSASGWTPIYSFVNRVNEDTSIDVVAQITDWTGTYGVKPPIDVYIGEDGLVADIENATAISGKSAYQAWLSQGNVGSEADFVNSLSEPPTSSEDSFIIL